MILRYHYLKGHPIAFRKLTGLEVARFDSLLTAIVPSYHEAERQRRSWPERQRAIGGGDHSDLEVRDQVLMTLIWLQQYPKQQVLASCFGVSQPTVWRCIQRVVPVLDRTGYHGTHPPDPGRKQRRNLAALLGEVPELLPVIEEVIRIAGSHSRSSPNAIPGADKAQNT